MAHVHRLTPSPALIFTTAVSLVVLIPGDFQSIVNFFRWLLFLRFFLDKTQSFSVCLTFLFIAVISFTAWFFYAITLSGLIYLKIKKPELPRPYSVSVTYYFSNSLNFPQEIVVMLVFPVSTGSHYPPHPGPHCGDLPCAGTHHRWSSDWIPLCDFIHLERSCNLRTVHPLQALPGTVDQADYVPAAVLRGRPGREKPVMFNIYKVLQVNIKLPSLFRRTGVSFCYNYLIFCLFLHRCT